jgi:cell division septum initiation protein DivIVA
MLRSVEVAQDESDPEADDVGSRQRGPNLSGDFDELLDTRPVFRTRVHGYDKLQVDNYVSWAEGELEGARRAGDHLLARLAACAAELAEHRRRPVPVAATAPDLSAVSERVAEILRLAADEADEILEVAAEEADSIVADARLEAEARLHKTDLLREAGLAAAEHLRERALRDRVEAAETVERARREAEQLLRDAAVERDRLDAEAAARRALDEERARQDRDSAAAVAAGRLLAVQDEVADLKQQRDEAYRSLRRLTAQIGDALHAVGAIAPEERIVRSVPELAS